MATIEFQDATTASIAGLTSIAKEIATTTSESDHSYEVASVNSNVSLAALLYEPHACSESLVKDGG